MSKSIFPIDLSVEYVLIEDQMIKEDLNKLLKNQEDKEEKIISIFIGEQPEFSYPITLEDIAREVNEVKKLMGINKKRIEEEIESIPFGKGVFKYKGKTANNITYVVNNSGYIHFNLYTLGHLFEMDVSFRNFAAIYSKYPKILCVAKDDSDNAWLESARHYKSINDERRMKTLKAFFKEGHPVHDYLS